MAADSPADSHNPFNFPFTPYLIQTEFMHELTSTLEAGKVGVFESPTGTVSSEDFASKF